VRWSTPQLTDTEQFAPALEIERGLSLGVELDRQRHQERVRRMGAFVFAIWTDTHDVLTAQISLVYPRRRDPRVTVLVLHGDVTAGGRGHFVSTVN